jgi:hypothetical protein
MEMLANLGIVKAGQGRIEHKQDRILDESPLGVIVSPTHVLLLAGQFDSLVA